MVYVSHIYVGGEMGGSYAIDGRGASEEEAKQDCLRKLPVESLVELAEGVLIPTHQVDKMPKEVPAGCHLVIFERSSHGDGHAYDWRFFAVKPGKYKLGDDFEERVVGSAPVLVNTTDSNSDAAYSS